MLLQEEELFSHIHRPDYQIKCVMPEDNLSICCDHNMYIDLCVNIPTGQAHYGKEESTHN